MKNLVSLSEAADILKMRYQSLFAKLERKDLEYTEVKDDNGKVKLFFTKKQLEVLQENSAKPISKDRVSLKEIAEKHKITTALLSRVLKKINIIPTKRRRHSDNKTVPTVSAKSLPKIRKALKTLS